MKNREPLPDRELAGARDLVEQTECELNRNLEILCERVKQVSEKDRRLGGEVVLNESVEIDDDGEIISEEFPVI